MLKNINSEGIKAVLKVIISLIIPVLIYATILAIDLPEEVGSAARYGVSWLLVVFAVLLYLTYSLGGWLGRALSLSSTLALFALPLARLWSTGASEGLVLGGLLPWSDANMYYWHAGNLLQGKTMFHTIHGVRPIFVGVLSFILGLTQQNLQIAIAILISLIATSCFLVAREIQQIYGTAAGVLVVLCLFIFIRPLIGSLMTENLGLCFGVLSFALLLRGARQMSMSITLVGLFVLSIGLNTRVGTFFVLPALLLWGGYVFRGSKWFSGKFLMGGVSVILLGFILNSLLLKVIGHPEGGSSYGNFAFVLYGIITQSNWTQIFQDYPEISLNGDTQTIQKIYGIAFEMIRDNPMILIRGIMRGWREFFWNNDSSIFFIERNELELGLRGLGSIGLVACLFQFHKPIASLIIMYALGVIASVPFVPLWDAGLRTYAVTIIIFPLLSALGLALILEKVIQPAFYFSLSFLKRRGLLGRLKLTPLTSAKEVKDRLQTLPYFQDKALPIFSIALIIVSLIGPIIIKQISHAPPIDNISCPAGLEARYFRHNPGSSINLVSDDAIMDTHLPNIRISDFRKGLKTFATWLTEEPKAFAKLNPGLTIVDTYNWLWLVTKSNLVPQEQGLVLACGKREKIGALRLFHADYLQPISALK